MSDLEFPPLSEGRPSPEADSLASRPDGFPERTKVRGVRRIFVYSAIGIGAFFIPFTFQGKSSILIDHLVTIVRDLAGRVVSWIIIALIVYGAGSAVLGENGAVAPPMLYSRWPRLLDL